jgi:hypothetical protein
MKCSVEGCTEEVATRGSERIGAVTGAYDGLSVDIPLCALHYHDLIDDEFQYFIADLPYTISAQPWWKPT